MPKPWHLKRKQASIAKTKAAQAHAPAKAPQVDVRPIAQQIATASAGEDQARAERIAMMLAGPARPERWAPGQSRAAAGSRQAKIDNGGAIFTGLARLDALDRLATLAPRIALHATLPLPLVAPHNVLLPDLALELATIHRMVLAELDGLRERLADLEPESGKKTADTLGAAERLGELEHAARLVLASEKPLADKHALEVEKFTLVGAQELGGLRDVLRGGRPEPTVIVADADVAAAAGLELVTDDDSQGERAADADELVQLAEASAGPADEKDTATPPAKPTTTH